MGLWGATEAISMPRVGLAVRAVDIEMVLPFFLVPLALVIGASSFTATVLVMIVLAMSLLYVIQKPRPNNRTQFFYKWTLSSVFYLFLVFELDVLTQLEITQSENLIFLLMIGGFSWCFYRVRATFEPDNSKGKDYSPVLTADSFHCPICQIEINNRYFHSVWLDVCISQANYTYYLLGLVLSDICLLYASNLGLTTVCQPYVLYWTILMPEDCSDVYYDFDLALCFMSAVYSLGYALVITLIIFHQCVRYVPKHIGLAFKRPASVVSA